MENTKHTPGPWELSALGSVRSANGYLVAEVLHAGSELEGRANGQLIAAAPDLLEGLKAVRAMLGYDDIYGESQEHKDVVAEKVRAAIAKAEGRA